MTLVDDCFLPIRFGGIALSQSVYAGQLTIPIQDPPFHLYSIQGTFLGPANIDVPTTFNVTNLRSTRTFQSRCIKATQIVNGTIRNVLIVLMDWHIQEPMSLLHYSTPPLREMSTYSDPEHLLNALDQAKNALSPRMATAFYKMFNISIDYWESKYCPNSMVSKTFWGYANQNKTDQDEIPITKRIHSCWFRAREKLQGVIENTAALR